MLSGVNQSLKSKVLCTSLTTNIKTPFWDRCYFVQCATILYFCGTVMFNATFRHGWLTLILILTGYEYEVNNDISLEHNVVIINVPVILRLSLMCCIVKIYQAPTLNSAGITGSSVLPVLSSKGQHPQSTAWTCLPRLMITGQIANEFLAIFLLNLMVDGGHGCWSSLVLKSKPKK